MNFFAIVADNGRPIKRIRLKQSLQKLLTDEFERQHEALFEGVTPVDFDPRYKVGDDEIFVIRNYQLPGTIENAILNINQIDDLRLNENMKIKSIFGAKRDAESISVYFQGFTKTQLLTPSFTILMSSGVYSKLQTHGLTLGTSLVAYYDRKNGLCFRSFALTSRFLNLQPHFTSATDRDITRFLQHKLFEVHDRSEVFSNADSVTRRLIAKVLASGVLEKTSATDVVDKASMFDLQIAHRNGRIVFPREKRSIKALLRFLLEGYYEGPLTGTKYISNSQRPFKKG